MSVWKLMRIVVLLSVFFVILLGTWMNERRLAGWERPIWVTVYPIAAEPRKAVIDYASQVDEDFFTGINDFLSRELGMYSVFLSPPVRFQVAPVTQELPPALPDRHSPVAIAWWSLKMRWWAWRMQRNDGLVAPDIQMFVIYHRPDGADELPMSVGMRKGMYGLVKAYVGKANNPHNQIVITHELLHVLGATDKYVFSTGDPVYPFGYAEPNKQPLFPQTRAEIMGGRIPLSSFDFIAPKSLEQCRIGRQTAEEIGLFARLQEG